jgi:hypothetical protein
MAGMLIQRIHPSLTIGQRLTLSGSKTAVHSAQGTWDGGCAIHAAAMALAMLGRLSDPGRVPSRGNGLEAKFWSQAHPHYLSGISLHDLENLLHELNCGVRAVTIDKPHQDVLAFCENELARERLVIVSWRLSNRRALHAVLVVGLEGRMKGRKFIAETLLLLDPSEWEPWMSACNARLTYAGPGSGKRHASYVTSYSKFPVVLEGALSIRAV